MPFKNIPIAQKSNCKLDPVSGRARVFRVRIRREARLRREAKSEKDPSGLSKRELQFFRVTGWTEAPEPQPGASPLDNLSRNELIKLWEESERKFGGRSSEELGFFADHGHWPEEKCGERNCSKNEFDELKKKFATQIKS